MNSFFQKLRLARDLFWPLPDPLSPAYLEQREAALQAEMKDIPENEAILESYIKTYADFLEQEEKRRQSVEGRLTNIMGLASIAGTIVFGTILAQIAGTVRIPPGILRWLVALGSLYLVMQVCSAIFASVRGLTRRTYLRITPADILQRTDEGKASHLRGLATKYMKVLAIHQSETNNKVTWMAAAHQAMQQFVGGLLLFALIGTYFAIRAPSNHDDFVDTVKKNRELQELLRGPAGPPGPVGPKGDPAKETPHRRLTQKKLIQN